MKKVLFCLLLASCTVQKQVPVYNSEAKVLFFFKHSDNSNEVNENKIKNWVNNLQKRFPDLYIVGKSFNVESSKSFSEQLKNSMLENKPKAVLSYEYVSSIPYRTKNKYIFILSDSTSNMIKDKVYHDYAWLGMQDILSEFSEPLEKLEKKYSKPNAHE